MVHDNWTRDSVYFLSSGHSLKIRKGTLCVITLVFVALSSRSLAWTIYLCHWHFSRTLFNQRSPSSPPPPSRLIAVTTKVVVQRQLSQCWTFAREGLTTSTWSKRSVTAKLHHSDIILVLAASHACKSKASLSLWIDSFFYPKALIPAC